MHLRTMAVAGVVGMLVVGCGGADDQVGGATASSVGEAAVIGELDAPEGAEAAGTLELRQSSAWAGPSDSQTPGTVLGFGYVMNQMRGGIGPDPRPTALIKAVYSAL